MSDATGGHFSTVGLPPPDYVDDRLSTAATADPSLHMPHIIQFDDWIKESRYQEDEEFPDPPEDMLADSMTSDGFPEPPPDYDLETEGHLIPPHKLRNPNLESRERVDLHNELRWNSKNNINVLDTKPELQKEIERRKVEKQKRAEEQQKKVNRNTLDKKLAAQYQKLTQQEEEEQASTEQTRKRSELEMIHEKIRSKDPNIPVQ